VRVCDSFLCSFNEISGRCGSAGKKSLLLPEDLKPLVEEAGKHWDWTLSTLSSRSRKLVSIFSARSFWLALARPVRARTFTALAR